VLTAPNQHHHHHHHHHEVLNVGVYGRAAWRHGAVDPIGAPGVPYTLRVLISTVQTPSCRVNFWEILFFCL